jgi:MPBQ/MSBQ methyltransferase
VLRRLADTWMLFPTEQQYRDWFMRAGFAGVEVTTLAPPWYRSRRAPYAVAVSGGKPGPGPSALPLPAPAETVRARIGVRTALRFAAGSFAGALFVPLAAALALRHRLQERRAR